MVGPDSTNAGLQQPDPLFAPISHIQDTNQLNWIVPCRRAVAKGTISYPQVVDAWIRQIMTYRTTLMSWYFSEEVYDIRRRKLAIGLYRIIQWKARFFTNQGATTDSEEGTGPEAGSVVYAAPDEGVTVNREARDFYVRLWKGPLRVLLEEKSEGQGQPNQGQNQPQQETQVDYPGTNKAIRLPALSLNDNTKEVENPDAQFIMGDVVEFPFHKFLSACGKSQYENITFNPKGSYFLGTSLKQGDQSPPPWESLPVHDNLLGMRFQLLLNVGLGAFCSLSEVFNGIHDSNMQADIPHDLVKEKSQVSEENRPSDANRASEGNPKVYSRGLIYGITLINYTEGSDRKHWRIFTELWGFGVLTDNLQPNLPTRETIDILPSQLPFTTGWSCSPFTLFLSYFVFNQYEGGKQNVVDEWNEPGSLLQNYYEALNKDGLLAQYSLNGTGDSPSLREMSDVFTDVNVISFGIPVTRGGHEIGVVRIFKPDRLMALGKVPKAAFLTAYHPLSGEDYFPPGSPSDDPKGDKGQLFICQAGAGAGGLVFGPAQSGGGRCGTNLFSWEVITNNSMYVHYGLHPADVQEDVNRLRISTSPGFLSDSKPRYVNWLHRLLPGKTLSPEYANMSEFKPIVIYSPRKREGKWTISADPLPGARIPGERSPRDRGIEKGYADRAVPFPTMEEAKGKFPNAQEVKDLI